MDGIVPPTSTRQPFGLYAATGAKRHYRGSYREEKEKHFSLHFPTFSTRCATTKEIQRDTKFTYDLSIYFLTNSSRQFYVKQFRKTIFDHFTVQTGDDRLTRMSINGMQIMASEQIKSAKSQNR
ncbi:hypothetical protein ALC56_07899 [Trachymyrmex septentrionalis]|uniref:Uncharacterized protein n=1 Tax=Trachymyrmex septentrionalis TaxID=34720 RepID=A0A195FAQ2_9HYME|nr:hypothetical protein ALC56_07899 [Trachymyrmex septentrionalis]